MNSRFRIAHLALLAQGLATGVLGGIALAWSMANPGFANEGIPILGLTFTPLQGGVFLVGGSLAVLACLGRRTTVGFSAIAAVGWTTLAVVSGVEAAHHLPGVLGFDPRDTLLYGGLAVYNVVVCMWLLPMRRHGR